MARSVEAATDEFNTTLGSFGERVLLLAVNANPEVIRAIVTRSDQNTASKVESSSASASSFSERSFRST